MKDKIIFLSRQDLKIIIVGTVVGSVLQIICTKYINNHPELETGTGIETKRPPRSQLRRFLPRGGAFIEFTGAKILVNIGSIITFVGKKGAIAGFISSLGFVGVKKIPSTALSSYLYKALPYSHSDDEKKRFVLMDLPENSLDDNDFTYLFKILYDNNIPTEQKIKRTTIILKKYFDLTTTGRRIRSILAIVYILVQLSNINTSGFFAMMQSLIEALQKGKISKRLARIIIRRLQRKGVPVDP